LFESRDDFDLFQLIASLKGLGNAHYLSPNVLSKLCECANDKTVRNRVRVAALETAQSDPNKDVVIISYCERFI
jgi:hypothetical protein